MTDHRDREKQSQGVTHDTVQQAAHVSRSTTTAGHTIDDSKGARTALDTKTLAAGKDATPEDKG